SSGGGSSSAGSFCRSCMLLLRSRPKRASTLVSLPLVFVQRQFGRRLPREIAPGSGDNSPIAAQENLSHHFIEGVGLAKALAIVSAVHAETSATLQRAWPGKRRRLLSVERQQGGLTMKERTRPRISRRSVLKSAGAVAGASVLPTRRLFAAGKKSIRVLTVADPFYYALAGVTDQFK